MAMKVSGNNWKTATPRMILDWHQFLRLSLVRIRFVRILPTRYLLFSVFFYLNENELIQQLCPTQYIENEISNSEISTSHKINEKKTKERSKDIKPTSKSSFLKLLKSCH